MIQLKVHSLGGINLFGQEGSELVFSSRRVGAAVALGELVSGGGHNHHHHQHQGEGLYVALLGTGPSSSDGGDGASKGLGMLTVEANSDGTSSNHENSGGGAGTSLNCWVNPALVIPLHKLFENNRHESLKSSSGNTPPPISGAIQSSITSGLCHLMLYSQALHKAASSTFIRGSSDSFQGGTTFGDDLEGATSSHSPSSFSILFLNPLDPGASLGIQYAWRALCCTGDGQSSTASSAGKSRKRGSVSLAVASQEEKTQVIDILAGVGLENCVQIIDCFPSSSTSPSNVSDVKSIVETLLKASPTGPGLGFDLVVRSNLGGRNERSSSTSRRRCQLEAAATVSIGGSILCVNGGVATRLDAEEERDVVEAMSTIALKGASVHYSNPQTALNVDINSWRLGELVHWFTHCCSCMVERNNATTTHHGGSGSSGARSRPAVFSPACFTGYAKIAIPTTTKPTTTESGNYADESSNPFSYIRKTISEACSLPDQVLAAGLPLIQVVQPKAL